MKKLKEQDFIKAAKNGSYVYCYLREKPSNTAKEKTPYYIGVASSSWRPFSKDHNTPVPKDRSMIRIMRQNLTKQQAFCWEIYYILHYGRVDIGTGILHNYTNGGEGAVGTVRSQEQRERYRIASTGRRHTEKTKERLREIRLGKTLSPETKQKISTASKGKKQSEEWIEKRMKAHIGAKRSEETKQRIREKAIGRKSPGVAAANSKRVWDEAARARHSEAMRRAAQRRSGLTAPSANG